MSIHSISKAIRYYPSEKEVAYLVSFIKEYFSYPERSAERNQIASFISDHLKKKNPHWTHRTVRLWFNNNKKHYLESESKENNSLKSKSLFSSPKKHILSTPLLIIPSSSSSNISSSSKSDSLVFFDDFDILFDNARALTLSDITFENFNNDINQICINRRINPLRHLPKNIPVLSFPPFIKHQYDINNLLNLPVTQDTPFWESPSFVRSSSFPYQPDHNGLLSQKYGSNLSNHMNTSHFSPNHAQQQSNDLSDLTIDPIFYLSSSHSLFISDHTLIYKPTFSSDQTSELDSKVDWFSCVLPEIIRSPITNVLPLSSNQFYITDSSHIYLIETQPTNGSDSLPLILKQNLLMSYNNNYFTPKKKSDQNYLHTVKEIIPKEDSKPMFMEMIDDKIFIAKDPNHIIIFDQNLDNNEILSIRKINDTGTDVNISMDFNKSMGNNQFYQYYSAFKMIRHENMSKFLIGYGNNVIFRMYDQNGQLNRNFIGHSHPILDFFQINDHLIASAQDSCLLLWDFRDQTPVLGVDFSPLLLTSNINFITSPILLKPNFPPQSNIAQDNFNDNINNNLTFDDNNKKMKIDIEKESDINRNDHDNIDNNWIGIGMALSDGRMRSIDIREPKPIKGFSNVVGVIKKFVCSSEDNKMAFFCSMPISYWECNFS